MKSLINALCLTIFLAGCAAEPVTIRPTSVVRPTYAIPGPGYLWRFHPNYGWGWYHPRFGWHLGWR